MKERDDTVYLKHILDAIIELKDIFLGLIRRLLPRPRFFKTGSFGKPKSLEKQLKGFPHACETNTPISHGKT